MSEIEILENLKKYLQFLLDNGTHKIFYNDLFWSEKTIDCINAINDLQQENKQLKDKIETILDFDYFKNECPLNIGFGDELENKAQDVFYEDEYCESCKDDYKTCWLKYFKKLQELKE